MRAFLAVEVNSEDVVRSMLSTQKMLAESGGDLKLVEAENLHFTMKFLGEVPDSYIPKIVQRLEGLTAESFDITYVGVGVFPNPKRISVIWVGTDPEGGRRLLGISEEIEKRFSDLPFPPDKRFHPHVTLARVRSGRGKERLAEVVESFRDHVFGKDRATSLKLKKSLLTPQGPVYSDIFSIPFGGTTS